MMGVTRLVIGALLSLGIARHVRSEEVCCPATKIIHSIFEAPPSAPPSRSAARSGVQSKSEIEQVIADAIADSWDVRRRLDTDDTCVDGRASAISTWAAASVDSYELQGELHVESDFTRFVYDMSIEQSYWALDDGGVAAAAQKVIVMTVQEDDAFITGWEFDEAVDPGAVCESGLDFVGHDMAKALKNKSMIFLILAAPDAKDSWTTWFENTWAYGFGNQAACGTECLVAVGDRTGGELVDDVHAALKLVDFGRGLNPFAECSPCLYTTTSTTKATTEPATTKSTIPSAAHTVLASSVITLSSLAVLANVM